MSRNPFRYPEIDSGVVTTGAAAVAGGQLLSYSPYFAQQVAEWFQGPPQDPESLEASNDSASVVRFGQGNISRTKTKMKFKRARKAANKKMATVGTVRRMLGQVLEKKQRALAFAPVSFTLANSGIVHSYNLTAQITQGTSDGQRVGDVITLNSVHMNGTFITALKGSSYKYRVLIGWSGEEFNPAGVLTTGLSTANVFVNSGLDATNMVVNTKAFTPIYDQIVEINSLLDAVNDIKTIRAVIAVNKKFEYNAAADTYGKKTNLYFVVVPQSLGVAPLDIGTLNINWVLKYADA